MKKLAIIIGLIIISLSVVAQSNYNEAIQQGDEAKKRGDFSTAISKYFAAEAFDPSKKEVVRKKINETFQKVTDLRKEAEIAKDNAEKERAIKQDALNQAEQFVNGIYFYNDRFALDSKTENDSVYFYYMDKNGDEVSKLGRWKNAEPFDAKTGMAKVNKNDTIYYVLDTLGVTREMSRMPSKEKLKEYLDIVKLVAKVEQKRIPPHMVEYEELVAIGVIAVQVLIKDKTPEQLERYNAVYTATAIKWAIRNEMRIRYNWYAKKFKAEEEYDQEEVIYGVDMAQLKVREAIYETILSIDALDSTENKEGTELTEMSKMVREAIAILPEQERKIIEYRFYENMQVKEIARETGLAPVLITTIVQSGLNLIREYLNSHDYYAY